MIQADILKAFTFRPLTQQQEEDLKIVHEKAAELAMEIHRVVNPQQCPQAVAKLAELVIQCRTAIEMNPRQSISNIQLVNN